MKNKNYVIIKTTYPDLKSAKNLAQIILEKNLAACVEFAPIESMYIWKGKIISDKEILVSIKTKLNLYKKIEKTILSHHKYETPQIVATEITQGSKGYFDWIDSSLSGHK